MNKPIVWSIAGSDSSGSAGIQADLKTFNSLGVHGCTVITAVTAQSNRQLGDIQFVSIEPQVNVMRNDLPPQAIKIGMLGNLSVINEVNIFFKSYVGTIVLDPVLITTTGSNLFSDDLKAYVSQLKKLFQYVEILTPNLPEAEKLLDRRITSYAEMEQGARDILSMGVKSVLIKGGHFSHDSFSQDYWTNGMESFWLASKRHSQQNFSGTGCTLSSAIAACCALGYSVKDAIVIAKMYVNQAMRLCLSDTDQKKVLVHIGWPESEIDLPFLSNEPLVTSPIAFPNCGPTALGLYPIVDDVEWLKKLLPVGVKTIQLRIKEKSGIELETTIKEAVDVAKQYDARLFINDHWELAIRCGAYGVHLGQDDLNIMAVNQLRHAGLCLGISTHCYYELARAHTFCPSYIASGPIFPTNTKSMTFSPLGLEQLKRWRRTLSYPLVAIGGINIERLPAILTTNVDGIAMISTITQAEDPLLTTKHLLTMVSEHATEA